ncbi:DUF1080 domain-containing protein [Luteolibacter pohnpeiensis]|uniref:DUF1080 domain-containing protein n=1 Tax=Luteolibacter pohnpeiensis TaxID=454153 RepID=A0A934VY48_9BACT|nr:DUF1080 domain-containing protein [Luteolibacter pohnpeiensis]MBK1884179.1 DUF1080 domain-containing protein [Luteolibacter pohnpeiensis]
MNRLHTPLLFLATCGTLFATENWTPLFNGKNLDGWVQRGGKASYKVEDGCIVGTSTLNTANSFLCTDRDYADFILEYDFKVDPRLNSGVQIRSQSFATPSEIRWNGKVINISANRVHGYQIEIDPNPIQNRWWSAGIYDEGRRGWLYPGILGGNAKEFTEQGRKIFKQEGWNHVRVEAIGHHLKTTLNGAPCASIDDSATASGFIALQVHSIDDHKEIDGSQVSWKNIRIQEIPEPEQNTLTAEEKAAGWKMLWDGKTSNGWRSAKSSTFPKDGWTMKDGVLTVKETGGAESEAGGDIITEDPYSDFELSVDFKITPGANSGIKFFVDPDMNQGKGSAIGPEFQILDDVRHPDAKLGHNGDRTIGSLYDLIPAPASKKVNPVGEWNNARILSDGKHLTYWLNGEKTIEIDRGSKEWRDLVAASKYKVWDHFGELPEGHILLQDHGNTVHFRNIKIRDFSKH